MRSEPAVSGSGLLQFLQEIPDPRGRQGQRHDFVAMLATVVCAMLCGHGGFDGIAEWIHAFDESLWHRLGYRRRPPSANCFRDLLNALDPRALEAALWKWTESLGVSIDEQEIHVVVVDGKKLRGAISKHSGMWHVLSAMDYKAGQVFREVPVPSTTNEAKVLLALIDEMVLQGKLIVGDAMFCQRDICQRICEKEGDYLVIVKKNQQKLRDDIRLSFAVPANFSPLPQTVGS